VATRPEPACLVIADIAGYTGYLGGVELDHAQDILADLVDTVVGRLRPSLRLAKLEGDAAFTYVIAETVDGSALQDTIETTYFAFRRRLRDIEQASQCECDACIRIGGLDLKFVVHHGLIVRQRVAGRDELLGRDVILVHRLLKNSIEERAGLRAYSFYTDACVRAMGVDPVAQRLRPHRETTDLGEIDGWLRDLEAAWREEQERTRTEVTAEEAYAVFAADMPTPPQVTWEYVTSPVRRPQWGPGISAIVEQAPAGRRGAGTVNHCMHGRDAVVEEVLDWRPYDYWTTRNTMPMPGAPKLVMTDRLIPLPDGGTRVEVRIGRPRPRERAAFEQLYPMVEPIMHETSSALRSALEAEHARLTAASADAPAEAVVPASAGRHLTEPDRPGGRTVDSEDLHSSSG
jgi:hypothetical protein